MRDERTMLLSKSGMCNESATCIHAIDMKCDKLLIYTGNTQRIA